MFSKIHTSFGALATIAVISVVAFALPAQSQTTQKQYRSLEISEADGIPVLIKNLPQWENVRDQTVFARDAEPLREALGDHPVLSLIDFSGGTEAVTATYTAGRLLIIEYSTPQGSHSADIDFKNALVGAGDTSTIYRRIGNYNAFVFDVADRSAAEELIGQIKYEKSITWLGENPFRSAAERAFVMTTADIFISTVFVIVIGIVVALVGGLIAGFFYFHVTGHRRRSLGAFSDAGGMTRLNLDRFTPDAASKILEP